MSLYIDESFIVRTLKNLVRIDSRNPNMTQDGPGEVEIGAYLAGALEDLGLRVRTHHLGPDRVNVVGILPGNGGGRTLMLNGHMDTVGVENMQDPFSGEIREGRLYGRGSQDMKGSLAAMLGTVKALLDAGSDLSGDLILAAVADEEDRSLGTRHLVQDYRAQGAIVTEPTDMEVVRAHRGLIWYQVETFGKAAHGSRFQEGVDAIAHMGKFLARLADLEEEMILRPPHPLVGPPSLHASLIQGGTDICTYAAHCEVKIDRRTVPGEQEEEVTAELQAIIQDLTAGDETFKAAVKPIMQRPALETAADAVLLDVLGKAYLGQMGHRPQFKGEGYWSDAALLADAGMEAVLLGPIGQGMHGPREWVSLDSVFDLARVLADTALAYCNSQGRGGES